MVDQLYNLRQNNLEHVHEHQIYIARFERKLNIPILTDDQEGRCCQQLQCLYPSLGYSFFFEIKFLAPYTRYFLVNT